MAGGSAVTTFEELWTQLKHDAAAAIATFQQHVVNFEAGIVPKAEAAVAGLLAQLGGIAIQAVLEVAKEEIAGHEKFGKVVTVVFQAAEAEAIAVAISDVQMLVQQAYNALAAELA